MFRQSLFINEKIHDGAKDGKSRKSMKECPHNAVELKGQKVHQIASRNEDELNKYIRTHGNEGNVAKFAVTPLKVLLSPARMRVL